MDNNIKEGICAECGKIELVDANNKDHKPVCEQCWYDLGYHLPYNKKGRK